MIINGIEVNESSITPNIGDKITIWRGTYQIESTGTLSYDQTNGLHVISPYNMITPWNNVRYWVLNTVKRDAEIKEIRKIKQLNELKILFQSLYPCQIDDPYIDEDGFIRIVAHPENSNDQEQCLNIITNYADNACKHYDYPVKATVA